jgi:hypothetical protein
LPCHGVCHTFVFVRAALDQTGYASNSALSVFSFAN